MTVSSLSISNCLATTRCDMTDSVWGYTPLKAKGKIILYQGHESYLQTVSNVEQPSFHSKHHLLVSLLSVITLMFHYYEKLFIKKHVTLRSVNDTLLPMPWKIFKKLEPLQVCLLYQMLGGFKATT